MFVIALTGYPNLMDNERRLGAYVLDAVQNGHWMIQKEISGELASKPPMLTWLAALSTLAIGELTRFAIYLPSALATIGVALLLLTEGRRHFGWAAGFLSALAYLLSSAGDRQMMTARYDGLLALPVTLAAVAAFRAWQTGRGWTWFWLAGAFGTLVKGTARVDPGRGWAPGSSLGTTHGT
jgi:4-amino-4-deoxy-L-arabinose transferase-like glycosyltransferase